jgi:hypothetical protein
VEKGLIMEYTFLNKKTKKIEAHEMKISEYDEFVKKHPNLERYHDVAPKIAGSRGGEHLDAKTDNGWKEVLVSRILAHLLLTSIAKTKQSKKLKPIKLSRSTLRKPKLT